MLSVLAFLIQSIGEGPSLAVPFIHAKGFPHVVSCSLSVSPLPIEQGQIEMNIGIIRVEIERRLQTAERLFLFSVPGAEHSQVVQDSGAETCRARARNTDSALV